MSLTEKLRGMAAEELATVVADLLHDGTLAILDECIGAKERKALREDDRDARAALDELVRRATLAAEFESKLAGLVKEWRQPVIGLDSYAVGYEDAWNECAAQLEALLREGE